MVRSYMRHGPTQAFGMVCSPTANSAYDGRLAYVPAWEDVLVWDVKLGQMLSMWHSTGLTSPVAQICPSPLPNTSSSTSPQTFAVAYADGSIRLWSFSPSEPSIEASEIVTFNGHKKSPTSLTWDLDGSRLASGGTEGEIVVWDTVAEVGLFRLKGHRGPVTAIKFIPHPSLPVTAHAGYLLSSAKDTYLKLWDLSTQHCIQTVVVGRSEVTSCDAKEEIEEGRQGEVEGDGDDQEVQLKGRWLVITGSGEGEGKAWTIDRAALARGMKETTDGELPTLVKPLCVLPLSNSSHPISQTLIHPTLPLILLQTSDRSTAILRLRTEEEVSAKRARRKKREKEKNKGKGGGEAVVADGQEDAVALAGPVKWEERVVEWCTVRANAKVKSFALPAGDVQSGKGGIPLLLALSNNSIEAYTVPSPAASARIKSKDTPEPLKTHSIELPGHRQDIRTLCISSDDQVACSAASGTLKVWNLRTGACLRTIECGYAVCSTFLPGDRHVVVGTKHGELILFDIAASSILSTTKAHTGPVWGIHVKPDGRGLVSGSADKDVKFWNFEMREEQGEGEKVMSRLGVETVIKSKQLTLVHTKTLKMADDVLAVRYSPDGRFLAVALLDSTVKIFFQDTLKFFLSLYGHKLPVLSLDISSDSKLIITCSADKNIKIWGMDFGDCHRSIFAHDDSVMQVAFERDSHYFWSVGKDRALKYWDGDKFDLIQRLDGHHAEIWALAVSNRGEFVITGSHDKSIRVWEKTEEPLFLEEEREREIERLYDDNLAEDLNRPGNRKSGGVAGTEGEGDDLEVEAVQKTTAESLMAGERIMEALEIADSDKETQDLYLAEKARLGEGGMGDSLPKPTRNAELVAKGDIGGAEFVMSVLKRIPAASMEDALLVLPFRQVVSLLGYLDEWAMANSDITLVSRLLFFLLRTHSNQITSSRTLRPRLIALRVHLRGALQKQREVMGYNLAGMKFLKARWESEKVVGMGIGSGGADEEEVRRRIEEGGRKRKRKVEIRA